MRRFSRTKTTIIAVPVLLIIGGCLFGLRNPNSAQVEPGTGLVKKEALVQKVTIAGSVIPNRRTIVTAPYQGYIKKIFVKVGDRIAQGVPVVSIAQSLLSREPIYPLRAPFPGTVVQVEKSEGEFIKEGDPKDFIVRIDDIDRLFVLANAPEIDRVKIKIGQEAVIKASAILGRSYKGIVRALSLAAKERESQWERSPVEFSVRMEVMDPDEQLHPGMSVLIDIITSQRNSVLTLRHEFIHRDGDKYFVIMKSGKRQPIEVGLQNEEAFEVKTGLKEGDVVKQVNFAELTRST